MVIEVPRSMVEGTPDKHILTRPHIYFTHIKHDTRTGKLVSQRCFDDEETRSLYREDCGTERTLASRRLEAIRTMLIGFLGQDSR